MRLPEIKQVISTGIYVPGDDIDTDRIIPARFMKCITFEGLGEFAFYDERVAADGTRKGHPFDDPKHAGATILLSGSNFGCGSSREHAPQALYRYGIRAILAESFAEIFFGNSTTLGIPCAVMKGQDIRALAKMIEADPKLAITVDVENDKVAADGKEFSASVRDGAKKALVSGKWDAIAELLEAKNLIAEADGRLPQVDKAL